MRKNIINLSFVLLIFLALPAMAKLSIVTSTSDLEALVQAVGLDRADVFSIGKGTQDPHHVEAKPSFMVKMRNADLVLSQGLELESAWLVPLINGARNPKITPGAQGFLELADKLEPLEIPKSTVTRADGDVHPGGNPHFQLDPIRMGQAAVLIANRMGELDPPNADFFHHQAEDLLKHLTQKTSEWQTRLLKTGLKEVVTYHKTFTYFLARFGIRGELQLEPRPGIPPTASHLMDLLKEIKSRKIRLVLVENYYDLDAAQKLKTEVSGLHVEEAPVSVGAEPDLKSTEQVIEKLVRLFEAAK